MNAVIPPGAAIGVLGGGQLGRMIGTAAAELGYSLHVFGHDDTEPAMQIAARRFCAAWDDEDALRAFAESCDVVTLEFENVPCAAVRVVDAITPVRPGVRLLEVAQDRGLEKQRCRSLGIDTAPFVLVDSAAALVPALASLGNDVVIKTTKFGYDGKGQARVRPEDAADVDVNALWHSLVGDATANSHPHAQLIVEGRVDFASEISILAARTLDGTVRCFPCARNVHEAGVLRSSFVPAGISVEVEKRATEIATALANELDVIGLLAVELFVAGDPLSAHADVLVNEIAPRPHNSGHWTQDGCATSQFAQLVRAICGLPLGSTERLGPMRMDNLLGDEVHEVESMLRDDTAVVHLYGKRETRPGRKMGHVNFRLS